MNYLFGQNVSSTVPVTQVWGKLTSIFGFNDLDKVQRDAGLDPFSPFSTGIMFSTGTLHPFANTSRNYSNGSPSLNRSGIRSNQNNISQSGTFDRAGVRFNYNSPVSGTFSGRLIFAGEEYEEYVNTSFNDFVKINVNGVNYAITPATAPAYGSYQPSPTNILSINSINHRLDMSGQLNNSYYIRNTTTGNAARYKIEPDGFTKVLSFSAPVKVGLNTFEIFVEDKADNLLDSYFYMEEGSFTLPGLCNANVAPSIPKPTLSNVCSSPTANLFDTGILSPGSTLVIRWFTTSNHLVGTEVANPTAILPGTYYAFYYDTAANCYSSSSVAIIVNDGNCCNAGTVAPVVPTVVSNDYPNNTVNLYLTGYLGTIPTGAIVRFYKVQQDNSLVLLTQNEAENAGEGKYVTEFYDQHNNCVSPRSTIFNVDIKICTEGSTRFIDLTAVVISNKPLGTNVIWYNGPDRSIASVVSDPTRVPRGDYYAFFWDPVINCYNTIVSTTSVKVIIYPACGACVKPGNPEVSSIFTKIGISNQSAVTQNWPESIPNGFIALESKDKGFVVSRVQKASDIIDPKEGMIIYDIDAKCTKLYNGVIWKCIEKKCND